MMHSMNNNKVRKLRIMEVAFFERGLNILFFMYTCRLLQIPGKVLTNRGPSVIVLWKQVLNSSRIMGSLNSFLWLYNDFIMTF